MSQQKKKYCPKCYAEILWKAGHNNSSKSPSKRYKCKNCKSEFTSDTHRIPPHIKAKKKIAAVFLSMEGFTDIEISKICCISTSTIGRWLRPSRAFILANQNTDKHKFVSLNPEIQDTKVYDYRVKEIMKMYIGTDIF